MMPADPRAVDGAIARRLRDAGFSGVSVVLPDPLAPTREELVRVRQVLADAGVRVAQTNPRYEALVNPDEARRREGVRVLRHACRCARWLESGNVYVRPGSLNPRGHWLPYPGNTSPETIDRLVRSLREVVTAAEEEGVFLAVEGHVTSPLDTPERIRDVIEAVGSPALRFNVDPVNFVGTFAEAYATTGFLNRMFDVLGQYTVCAHIKDVKVEDRLVVHIAECIPGEGLLDMETFLRRFDEAAPDGYALIEHLRDEDQILRAKRAVDAATARAGLTWRG